MQKYKILIISILFIVVLVVISIKKTSKETENINYYHKYVITNKDSDIYAISDSKTEKIGTITKGEELTLEPVYKGEYYKIANLGCDCYINYKDTDKIDKLSYNPRRYKKYIPFNKNIITKEQTNLYDEFNNLLYTINSSLEFVVIINKSNQYGVEFNNKLLYIKNKDILKTISSNNSDLKNTEGIAVLNYHFFFDDSKESEVNDCNQRICLSTNNLIKQLDYIKENNIFTPTMQELEMYIDGYIQLPKSVVLTIDDGWRASIGSNIITEYKLNSTVFLMSKYYNPNAYITKYTEVHSHGHDIHNQGVCKGGQGGAIKCLEKSKLLEDLRLSREKLSDTTVFCYPFYEYNNYSIEVLKEAGFTMAFAGPGSTGNEKVKPGINKYTIPRYIIYKYTTVEDIKKYIG